MNTPLINPYTLFAEDPAQHVCCSCCEGYCPMAEGGMEGDPWPWMYRIEVAGVAYLTDRYVAVRVDVCQPMPEGVQIRDLAAQKNADEKGFIVPDGVPSTTTARVTARVLDRVYGAGLTICGEPSDGLHVLHLYRDATHVGWVMTANGGSGITSDQLPVVRRVADAAGITLRQAEKALWAVMEG